MAELYQEYLRRNLLVAKAIGAKANASTALKRLEMQSRPPQWLVNALRGILERVDPLPADLAKWRDTAPDVPDYVRAEMETPADLVGALQDKVHADSGPFRAGRSVKETPSARHCVWRDGCKNPSVCDKQGVCVPGGEATDCTCKDYPGADEFCTAHKADDRRAAYGFTQEQWAAMPCAGRLHNTETEFHTPDQPCPLPPLNRRVEP